MREPLPWLACWVALACSHPVRSQPPAPLVHQSSTSPASVATSTRAPVELTRTFTGQARPSLVVENAFPIEQHVFIDWVDRATLAPGATQRFELDAGTHTTTCADSADPDDHAASVSEELQSGYEYRYRLRPAP